MPEPADQLTEEEIAEAVADALQEQGLEAFAQDTGGGITCVVLERAEGGEISWGTADVNWGATVSDEEGEYVSAIQSGCPSDSQDVQAIAEAIRTASAGSGVLTRVEPA